MEHFIEKSEEKQALQQMLFNLEQDVDFDAELPGDANLQSKSKLALRSLIFDKILVASEAKL